MRIKIQYEVVKDDFLKQGFILMTDKQHYKNSTTPLEFICKEHPEFIQRKSYSDLKKGTRCIHCHRDSIRFDYAFVANYFKEHGCELLSKEYNNVDEKLDYICKCGNVDRITFYKFRKKGRRCRQCGIKKLNHAGIKHYYSDVKRYMSDFGYILLTSEEDYKNAITNVKICCDQGHEYEATFKNFKKNRRCPICNFSRGETAVENILTENNIKYSHQYIFNDLLSDKGANLRYDFGILKDNQLICLIEYDGEFHFHKLYEGDAHEQIVDHDQRKNNYCVENGIHLYRLPYWKFKSLKSIIENILVQYKLTDKIKTKNINKYLVNHSEWSYDNYIKQAPKLK